MGWVGWGNGGQFPNDRHFAVRQVRGERAWVVTSQGPLHNGRGGEERAGAENDSPGHGD